MGLAARRALEGRIVILDGADLLANSRDLLDKLKILQLGFGNFPVELPESDQATIARDGREEHSEGDDTEGQAEASRACLLQ